MILIDRNLLEQTIVLTLDGKPNTSLFIRHDATREEFSITLGDNLSVFSRYDKFKVLTSDLETLPEGFYSYWINSALDGSKIEEGKLLVKPSEAIQVPSAPDANPIYKVFTK
jgi:hypothetical protein